VAQPSSKNLSGEGVKMAQEILELFYGFLE
jgi:hypothetical protein